MKKKMFNSEKKRTPKEQLGKKGFQQEELLDLDSLLDVQGGKEDDDKVKPCGLGCFSGSILRPKEQEND